jgi:hypothetical protein
MDGGPYAKTEGAPTVTAMTELVTSARERGTGDLLLTSGLLVLYMGLRGTARALGALETVATR